MRHRGLRLVKRPPNGDILMRAAIVPIYSLPGAHLARNAKVMLRKTTNMASRAHATVQILEVSPCSDESQPYARDSSNLMQRCECSSLLGAVLATGKFSCRFARMGPLPETQAIASPNACKPRPQQLKECSPEPQPAALGTGGPQPSWNRITLILFGRPLTKRTSRPRLRPCTRP